MKLKKLKVKKYKNLIDFEVNFESGEGLSILIGNNGSGKSNVLEAISGIFANAYSAKAIHKFVYTLTYEMKGKEVKLEQTIYRCQYYVDGKVTAIKEFAGMIAEHTSTPIEFYDERLSTVSAHRFLSEGMGVKAKKHKNIVDSLAAEIILQSYMDSKRKTNLS